MVLSLFKIRISKNQILNNSVIQEKRWIILCIISEPDNICTFFQ